MNSVKVVFLPYYRGKSLYRRMTFGQFGAHNNLASALKVDSFSLEIRKICVLYCVIV